MENVFRGLHWKTLLLYLDDVIVVGNTFENHCNRLEEVFSRLRTAGLKLKPSKCELFQTEVKYLGHIVSNAGVATDPVKIESVSNWPIPSNVAEIRSFLGTVGYYRQYIKSFASVAKPLTHLTKKGEKFV